MKYGIYDMSVQNIDANQWMQIVLNHHEATYEEVQDGKAFPGDGTQWEDHIEGKIKKGEVIEKKHGNQVNFSVRKPCVAFVGAGGKTSNMLFLARECAKAGKKVLVTTSTHMLVPEEEIAAFSMEEIFGIWEKRIPACIGSPVFSPKVQDIKMNEESYSVREKNIQTDKGTMIQKKWGPPSREFFEMAYEQADIVFIEADGSKRKPCKVMRENEPVIWEQVTHVISVIGMTALGKSIEEAGFPTNLMAQTLNVNTNHILTLESSIRLMNLRVCKKQNNWHR